MHNQRIERLWRTLFLWTISHYYEVFCWLERSNNLNVENDLDMWCLHQVFLPAINHALDHFARIYNHHKLKDRRSKTPMQLFVAGASTCSV